MATEARVLGEVHFTHPTYAETANDTKAAEGASYQARPKRDTWLNRRDACGFAEQEVVRRLCCVSQARLV